MDKNNASLPPLDVSVVTYNSAGWLDAFFSSLKNQDYPLEKIHLWIRDNGSTDTTVALLKDMQSAHPGLAGFQIECGENAGFGQGHNANVKRGSAPYVLVTNVDLTFESDAIVTVIRQAIADGDSVASWELRQKPYEHPKYYNPVTLETSWSSSACVLFKRTAFEKIAGYEPRIFMYGEDVELSYRLRDAGYILKYCPSAVCWHHTYASAHELKPLQFLGSTLANCYIRIRYGRIKDMLLVPVILFALLLLPQRFPRQRWGLLKNAGQVLRNTPYFLRTRKRSAIRFPIRGMDYERSRLGAFYEHHKPMHAHPLVSVIVRTYGGRLASLKEAIASVLNQTYQNVELVVVEDGSDSAKNYIAQIAALNRLALVKYQSIPKGGRCKAGNAGLAACTGDYVNFLDDDDLLFADHLENLVQAGAENPEMGAVYSVAWQVRTHIISKEKWQYQELGYDIVYQESFNRALLFISNYIPIQSILFKRALYRQHGGFNENLPVLEDWELWLRYAIASDFLFVPKLTSLYRVPANDRSAISRWKDLTASYEDVLRETDKLKVNLSLGEVRQMAELIARRTYSFRVKRSALRTLFFKIPFAGLLYRLAVMARRIKRGRQR